jgi:hypothetical protein
MNSLADALPPEIAQKIHPDWRKNEAAYGAVRDQLLGHYQGQWIAFADGAVIAAHKTSLEVLHTPGVVEQHAFVTCVGREDEPYRIRRATLGYSRRVLSWNPSTWKRHSSAIWSLAQAVT